MFLNIYWSFLGVREHFTHEFKLCTIRVTFIHVDITLLLARSSSY